MESEEFAPIALLEKHPTVDSLREALLGDEALCQLILSECTEMAGQLASFPNDTRQSVMCLVDLMERDERPLFLHNHNNAFWTAWATRVFLFNEAGPALRQLRANRLEAAFAAPDEAPLPEPRRARF